MNEMPGIKRPALPALPQIKDRMTFLYLERCQLNREQRMLAQRNASGRRWAMSDCELLCQVYAKLNEKA